jgi:hypothetical protein
MEAIKFTHDCLVSAVYISLLNTTLITVILNTMLKSPFKFLGFNGFAKTPKPSPHNDRKTRGKLRKVRHPANTTIDTADRPSTPMGRKFEVNTSTVVSKRRESGEHYQNQVSASASSACNWIRTMHSPRVYCRRPSRAYPISTVSMPLIHLHHIHKPMEPTIYHRYLKIRAQKIARDLQSRHPHPVTLIHYGTLYHLFTETRLEERIP